jgi:predicted small secreted protein
MIRYKGQTLIVMALFVLTILVLAACGGNGGGGY